MSFVISAPSVTELRFDAVYSHVLAYLMEIDPARFRGLGDENCKAFVRKGLAFCDAHKINFKEHIEYVHFIMYFIGSGFPQDPRYSALTAALIDPAKVSHVRIDTAHRMFRQLGERFIGVGLEHTRKALARYHEQLGTKADDMQSPRHVFDAFYNAYDFASLERDRFPEDILVQSAARSAQVLDVDTPLGQSLCLSLTLWLGTGFADDPLYPWVRDIPAKASEGPHERARMLKDFAEKRMIKMLPTGDA